MAYIVMACMVMAYIVAPVPNDEAVLWSTTHCTACARCMCPRALVTDMWADNRGEARVCIDALDRFEWNKRPVGQDADMQGQRRHTDQDTSAAEQPPGRDVAALDEVKLAACHLGVRARAHVRACTPARGTCIRERSMRTYTHPMRACVCAGGAGWDAGMHRAERCDAALR